MLTFTDRRFAHGPSLLGRRDFLRIGSLCGLTPLLLAGGGLKMGQAIGRSDRTGSRPASEPYGPENLLATVLHTMFDAAEVRISPGLLPPEVSKAVLDGQSIKELF